MRWVFANKREIDSAVFQWSRDKLEKVKKSEAICTTVSRRLWLTSPLARYNSMALLPPNARLMIAIPIA